MIEKKIINEDRVIIVTILTSFFSSILMILIGLHPKVDLPPVFVSLFLATGVSSLIYRFLGGTKGASFTTGALKVGGSAALLLGTTWFLNTTLEKQMSYEKSINFYPDSSQWYCANMKTGKPMVVEIKGLKNDLKLSTNESLKNQQLNVYSDLKDNGILHVTTKDSFEIGIIHSKELKDLILNKYNSLKPLDFFTTAALKPQTLYDIAEELPFKIMTGEYSNERSRYKLIDRKTKKELHKGSIYRRNAEIVKIKDTFFVISVVGVNHKKIAPFAKFSILKLLSE